MSKATQRHLAAINHGQVTKTNVIGIRKALNAFYRLKEGWSVSSTCPKISYDEMRELNASLEAKRPIVRGDLHASGVRLLYDRRNKKRLAAVADKVAALCGFSLVGFVDVHRGHHVPVYEAWGNAGKFTFYNVPWQAALAYGLETGPVVVQA